MATQTQQITRCSARCFRATVKAYMVTAYDRCLRGRGWCASSGLPPARCAEHTDTKHGARSGEAQGGDVMLYEILHTRQIQGESQRRWFMDNFFDLIVWLSESQAIIGFRLVYDKRRSPHALTWCQDSGYGHHKVDDGENRPDMPKAAPILLPDGPFDPQGIGEAFAHASAHMDTTIAQFVRQKIVHTHVLHNRSTNVVCTPTSQK